MVDLPPWPRDINVRDLTLALNYKCNSRCRFCFIEPEIAARSADTTAEIIDAVFAKNRELGTFERIIFSGAEATLRPDLPQVVSRARNEGGFDYVRIQTNARRLRDDDYCRELIDAGLTEFFVSIHAPTAELDAFVTGAAKGFDEMRAGLKNIRAAGAQLISNTAVTADNYKALPELARFLVAEGVTESQLWSFIEFGDIGQAHQHVRFSDAMPYLHEAVGILRDNEVQVVMSWFPQCLLGEHADRLENHRSFTLILDEFSQRMYQNADFDCPHADSCTHFRRTCIGLHSRYRELFGDERDLLTPHTDGELARGPGGIGRHRPR